MIILKLSPGFANQLFQYMAGYSLAKKLNTEMILDISECASSQGNFLLDFMNIPKHSKIKYLLVDAEHMEHTDLSSIPSELKENKIFFLETESNNKNTFHYKGLHFLFELDFPLDKDIYLCGYFSSSQYYIDYLEEFRNLLILREETLEVKLFKNMIFEKTTVGIHMRRGDFLLTPWAEIPPDDFWTSSVTWFRSHVKNCTFFVFSDDIEYARKVLGQSADINYVHFGTDMSSVVNDFTCLSLCYHKILSIQSTFSRLADILQGKQGRIILGWDINYSNYTLINKFSIYLRRFLMQLYGKKNEVRKVLINDNDIKILASKYKYSLPLDTSYKTIFEGNINQNNCEKALYEISRCCLNISSISMDEYLLLQYRKFIALVLLERYGYALELANSIYEDYKADKYFIEMLIRSLEKTGAYEEAAVEAVYANIPLTINSNLQKRLSSARKLHFIIVPFCKSKASCITYDLTDLGQVLYHLGHDVTYVFEPIDDAEKSYISNNSILTTRRGIKKGGNQYDWNNVVNMGIEDFITLARSKNDNLIILSRRKEFFKIRGSVSFFIDFSDVRDAEKTAGLRENCDIITKNADIILTRDSLSYTEKYLIWKDIEEKSIKNIEHIDDYYYQEKQNSMSIRHIYMAATLIQYLNTIY